VSRQGFIGMSTPRHLHQFNVRLTEEERLELKRLSVMRGMTPAALVKGLIMGAITRPIDIGVVNIRKLHKSIVAEYQETFRRLAEFEEKKA